MQLSLFSKQWISYSERNPSMPFTTDRPIIPFLPPLFIFFSSFSSPSSQGPRAGPLACQPANLDLTCPSGLSQPAKHSVSQFSFRINSVKVNISGSGKLYGKYFPFCHRSQMSTLIFHTARHFPVLANCLTLRSFQPVQKISDIIAT